MNPLTPEYDPTPLIPYMEALKQTHTHAKAKEASNGSGTGASCTGTRTDTDLDFHMLRHEIIEV